MAGFGDYYNNAMYAAQNPWSGGYSPTKGQVANYAFNSPIAQQGINKGIQTGVSQIPTGSLWRSALKQPGGWTSAGIGIGTSLLANKLKPKAEAIEMGNPMHGDIVNAYRRREEGPGSGIAANAIDWAGKGATYGGWIGAGAGAAAGAIRGAVTKKAKSAYSDFLPDDARGAITQAYQKYLGRDPEEGAVEGWMAGQGWKPGDKGVGQKHLFEKLDEIANSPEAQRRTGVINTGPTPGGGATSGWRPGPINVPSSFIRGPQDQELVDRINRRSRGEAA